MPKVDADDFVLASHVFRFLFLGIAFVFFMLWDRETNAFLRSDQFPDSILVQYFDSELS